MDFFDVFPTFKESPFGWTFLFLIPAVSITALYHHKLYHSLLLHPYEVSRGRRLYSLITAAFVHTGWKHLLFNVFWIFGFSYDLYGVVNQELPSQWVFLCALSLTLIFIVAPFLFITYRKRKDLSYTTVGASGLSMAQIGFCFIFYPLETISGSWWIPTTQAYQGWLFIFAILCLFLFRKNRNNHLIHLFSYLLGTFCAFLIRPEAFQQVLEAIFGI